jgi:hypothetical protein
MTRRMGHMMMPPAANTSIGVLLRTKMKARLDEIMVGNTFGEAVSVQFFGYQGSMRSGGFEL